MKASLTPVKITLFLLSLLYLLPTQLYLPLADDIDSNWRYSITWAFLNKLKWGTDVVFSYGPLGFLTARVPEPAMRWWYLGGDVAITLSIVSILAALWGKLHSYVSCILLTLICYSIGAHGFNTELSPFLLVMQILHLLLFLEEKKLLHLIFAVLIAAISFYIKINTGIIGVALIFLAAIILPRSQITETANPNEAGLSNKAVQLPNTIKLALVASTLFLIILLAFALNVDLYSYISNSTLVISGYLDNNFKTAPGRELFILPAIGTIALLFLVLGANLKSWRQHRTTWFQILCAVTGLLVMYKQGFTRADGHELSFYSLAPAFLGILSLFSGSLLTSSQFTGNLQNQLTKLLTISLFISVSVSPFNNFFRSSYLNQLQQTDADWHKSVTNLESYKLPLPIIARLKNDTVDIMTTDTLIAPVNNLPYNPRPVIQSYKAYLPELDALNATKLKSTTAPSTIIFKPKCIDNRYCLAEESLTRRTVIENYDLNVITQNTLILKKGNLKGTFCYREVGKGEAALGDWIDLPSAPNSLIYFAAEVNYNPLGRIKNTLYKPTELGLKLEIKKEEGGTREQNFRMVRGILKGGFIANRYIETLGDYAALFAKSWESLNEIKRIAITTDSTTGFTERFNYTFYKFDTVCD